MDILIINKNRKTILKWESRTSIQKYKDGMEMFAKKINSSTKLQKTFIFVAGSFLYFQNVMAVSKNPLNKIEVFGKTIFGMCLTIGYWLVLVMGIIDILKSLMQGDTKSIPKIVLHYALAYAALLLFPWLLDLIKSIFI